MTDEIAVKPQHKKRVKLRLGIHGRAAVAKKLGVTPGRVSQIATILKISPKRDGQRPLYTPHQIAKIKAYHAAGAAAHTVPTKPKAKTLDKRQAAA